MTKHLELPVDRFQASTFLEAVRSKRDVIQIWMVAIKSFLTNHPAAPGEEAAKIAIFVSSMSRLFCELSDGRKIFSIAFPFSVRIGKDGETTFYSREGVAVDHRMSSHILELIQGAGVLEANNFNHFVDPIIDAVDISPEVWGLLRELMLAEDAYIRYDWDAARVNGHLHPEFHLDLNYTSSSSFKLGLRGAIDKNDLLSILDVESNCFYLHPPT